MRWAAAVAVAGILVAGAAGAGPRTPEVDYRVSPVVEHGGLKALSISLRFRASAGGVTRLTLPEGYGAGREAWKNVRGLRVEGATAVETPEPGQRRLRARPGAWITVAYDVVPPFDHEPRASETEQYQPVIRPDWFYVVGSSLFARPYDDERATAGFAWDGRGTGIAGVSDLETPPRGERWTLADVWRSVVVGGRDLKITRAGDVRVAMIGDNAFDSRDAAALAEKILRAETDFWGDPPAPFLITIVPTYAPSKLSKVWTGTGRAGGFATQITPNVELPDLAFFYAHENFHRWNSGRLGGQGDDGKPGFWFSEGFTDFYAYRLLVRSGVVSPQEFLGLWNTMLASYAASPARTATNAELAAGFWTDPAKQRMAYRRGALLAALWDARLRRQTNGRVSLDDLMRAQRDAVRAGRGEPAFRLFPKIAAGFGLDLGGDLARYVDRGEPIELPADVFGDCARVVWREQPAYDRGWDIKATGDARDVVTGLREGSAGWRAGLRNGMLLLDRRGGRADDSSLEVTYVARDAGGAEREYRFKPEGAVSIRLQQAVLTAAGADPGCLRPGGGF